MGKIYRTNSLLTTSIGKYIKTRILELTLPKGKYMVSVQVGGLNLCEGGLLELHGDSNVNGRVTKTTNSATPGFILNCSIHSVCEVTGNSGLVYSELYLNEENTLDYGYMDALRII